MQEHEYRARDKTVKKMSRDGLKEENLHSRKSIRVSNRETDDFFCATQAEDMKIFQSGEKGRKIRSLRKRSCIRKKQAEQKLRKQSGRTWRKVEKTGGFQKNADTGIGECQMAGRNRGSRQQYRGTFV